MPRAKGLLSLQQRIALQTWFCQLDPPPPGDTLEEQIAALDLAWKTTNSYWKKSGTSTWNLICPGRSITAQVFDWATRTGGITWDVYYGLAGQEVTSGRGSTVEEAKARALECVHDILKQRKGL